MAASLLNSGGWGRVFLSTFEKQVDGKHRLLVPSDYRALVGGDDGAVYCFPSLRADCVEGGGEAFLGRYRTVIETIPYTDPARLDMEEAVFGAMHRLEFDSGGRITIPEAFREALGLKAGALAVIVGVGDRFQIWTREGWAARRRVNSAKAIFPTLADRQKSAGLPS